MRARLIGVIIGASFLASGCSTFDVPHTCPLQGGVSRCTDMQEAYRQAKKASVNSGRGTRESVLAQMSEEEAARGAVPGGAYPYVPGWAPPSYQEVFQGFAAPSEPGTPVYTQARVHRAWVAPWTDADGRLHSGEYLYFTTPGNWNYGTTRATGQAGAAMMGPVRPEQLGFNPDLTDKRKVRQQQVPARSPAIKGAAPSPASPETARSAPVQQVDGVTQPYRRFGDDANE